MDVPSLAGALQHVTGGEDPIIALLLAEHLDVDAGADTATLRASAMAGSVAQGAFAAQSPDGSWGDADDPRRRILPTLWMVKTLAELGLSCHPGWTAGASFLASVAHTDEGVLSLDGTRPSVLSCYVGIAASTYLRGDRSDLAAPQIAWIVDHQDVRTGGRSLRSSPVEVWHPSLAVRFGGCLSDTTCAVGLVKTGRALVAWQQMHDDPDVADLVAPIRESFLQRELFRTTSGGVVPLAVVPSKAADWLEPTYPLDWRTDLIEVIDLVASSGPPDERMQPALDELRRRQLPDHTWPLRRSFRPPYLPLLERRNARRGSPYVTLRVANALRPLGALLR